MPMSSKKSTPPHIFTLFVRKRNPQLTAEPFDFRGRPGCFSKNRSLWNVAKARGTIWVVISEPRGPKKRKLYRLAYQLVKCDTVERETPWGPFGVLGDADASVAYGSNDLETTLMAVRFAKAVPIQSRRSLGFRLSMKQRLSAEGIERIKAFADYLPRRWSVFLSYSHDSEAEQAIWLAQALQREGKSVFRDGGALRAGQIWNEKIDEAIDSARYFVVLCSNESARSRYVKDEVKRALERPRAELKILPVMMPGADKRHWSKLSSLQWVDWSSEGSEGVLEALLSGIGDSNGPVTASAGSSVLNDS